MTENQSESRSDLSNEKLSQLLNDQYSIQEVLRDLISCSKPNLHSFFVSFLQKFSDAELSFYMPQLVNLSFHFASYKSYSLFFHSQSIKSHNFALRLFWRFLCCSTNQEIKGVNNEIMKLENCIINGRVDESSADPMPIYSIKGAHDDILYRKLNREQYFDQQKRFFDGLVKKSEELNQDSQYLDVFLTSFLIEVNTKIAKLRMTYRSNDANDHTARLYRGIVVPFEMCSNHEQIVRVVPAESFCIRTKSRVPYLIVFETVELDEDDLGNCENVRGLERQSSVDTQSLALSLDAGVFVGNRESPSRYSADLERSSTQEFKIIVFNESWEEKSERLRKASPFGFYSSWKLRGLIVKSYDDLRQEALAMQIICKCKEIFDKESLGIYLRPYEIIVTGPSSGMIEYIPDTKSIHDLKKENKKLYTLKSIFSKLWSSDQDEIIHNFTQSMAGYSLVSYILNLKDRHNKNLLIDSRGHIIHIDFGFFLTSSPGGNFGFESSPFKLNSEMIEVMGGYKGDMYIYFKMQVCKGFLALRKKYFELEQIIEIMQMSSDFPCFNDKKNALKEFRERFFLDLGENSCLEKMNSIIEDAEDNWTTNQYDYYQERANDIYA